MERIGEWRFAVRKCRHSDEFIAWCAKTDDLGTGPLEVDLAEEVHFEFGQTPEAALAVLKKEVLN